MPLAPRHTQQKSKNVALFAVLLAVVVLLFALAALKVSGTL